MKDGTAIALNIDGIGIIMYSEHAVSHINDSEDYLEKSYTQPNQVLSHIYNGSIVGFGTGSPGRYILKLFQGYPEKKKLESFEFKLRLGINVRGGKVFFRDLYDLMEWSVKCPDNQVVEIENGFYHITLCSNFPNSGILGDNQEILVYLNKLKKMPKLRFTGVPMLCY